MFPPRNRQLMVSPSLWDLLHSPSSANSWESTRQKPRRKRCNCDGALSTISPLRVFEWFYGGLTYPVSPCEQGDPEGECCDMRQVVLRNKAATSEIIPALSIRRTKLIGNQLGLHVVYIASCIPSEIITINNSSELQQLIIFVRHNYFYA